MFDIAPLILPPTIEIPGDETRAEPVKRKKDRNRRRAATVAAIGAILILSDGTKCQVVGYDQQGQPLCVPVEGAAQRPQERGSAVPAGSPIKTARTHPEAAPRGERGHRQASHCLTIQNGHPARRRSVVRGAVRFGTMGVTETHWLLNRGGNSFRLAPLPDE